MAAAQLQLQLLIVMMDHHRSLNKSHASRKFTWWNISLHLPFLSIRPGHEPLTTGLLEAWVTNWEDPSKMPTWLTVLCTSWHGKQAFVLSVPYNPESRAKLGCGCIIWCYPDVIEYTDEWNVMAAHCDLSALLVQLDRLCHLNSTSWHISQH